MEDKPISKMEFIELLKAAGIKARSQSWDDYSAGKNIINAINKNYDSRLYDIYRKWLEDWIEV